VEVRLDGEGLGPGVLKDCALWVHVTARTVLWFIDRCGPAGRVACRDYRGKDWGKTNDDVLIGHRRWRNRPPCRGLKGLIRVFVTRTGMRIE